MKNKFLRLIRKQNWILTGMLMILLACTDKGEMPDTSPVGLVGIFNASAYEPSSFDIYLDDKKINSSVFNYSSYSGYLSFPEGSNNLKINTFSTTSKLTEGQIDVIANYAYSAFIINSGAGIELFHIRDISPSPTEGKARVRFINLSPDSQGLRINNTSDSSVVFINQPYKGYSDYTEVSADGTSNSLDLVNLADDKVLSTSANLRLNSGRYYTLVAKGFVNPPVGNNNKLTIQVLSN